MNNVSPAHLSEIFPLRLRPRQEMRFAHGKDEVLAEKIADGQRYVLKPWQYEMMRRFDGERTFEEIAKEIYGQFQGEFSAVGLTNFYQWLYDENLVLCECDSIFELVADEKVETVPLTQINPVAHHRGVAARVNDSVKESLGGDNDWQRNALKISAIILVSLAVLRIAYIAAPILEPPVNLVYSSIERYFYQDSKAPAERRSGNELLETPVQELELAGRAPVISAAAPPKVDSLIDFTAIPEPPATSLPTLGDLESLRREMAECRIRRDEFYLQNNEIGYRYEVQKMTALARQIGEIEARLD
ncbi:MAG: hypothetical protein P1U58_08110 [Verrucomicrobiales bacterium]|nr:hypothetical protein [Verrucomicrobiales bacterium]